MPSMEPPPAVIMGAVYERWGWLAGPRYGGGGKKADGRISDNCFHSSEEENLVNVECEVMETVDSPAFSHHSNFNITCSISIFNFNFLN